MERYTALCFGGLQDYRADRSETTAALIISDKSPASAALEIGTILRISEQEVKKRMDTQ